MTTPSSTKVAAARPCRPASKDALTDREIRNAPAFSSEYYMSEPGGLRVIVRPNGGKWFRFRYRFNGVEKQLAIGTYPNVSLAQARDACLEAKSMLAKGIDPMAQRKLAKQTTFTEKEAEAPSFESVANEWLDKMWKSGYGA